MITRSIYGNLKYISALLTTFKAPHLFLQQIFKEVAKVFMLILWCWGFTTPGFSQVNTADSLSQAPTAHIAASDSILQKKAGLIQTVLQQHPFFNFKDKAVPPPYSQKTHLPGKEIYFYIMAALLLFFAILRAIFDKYFSDLFNLFFRRSLRQKQIKQQVVQNALPSLLFNIFFILTAGYYACLVIRKLNPHLPYPFWQLLLYCIGAMGVIYLGKYLVLSLLGMIFRIQKLTTNYIFLIFLINKIVAILLLPLLLIISVTDGPLNTVAWTLSWILLLAFISYRYIVATGLVRKESNISFSHFLLYALAFEILPTILLYKAILLFLK